VSTKKPQRAYSLRRNLFLLTLLVVFPFKDKPKAGTKPVFTAELQRTLPRRWDDLRIFLSAENLGPLHVKEALKSE